MSSQPSPRRQRGTLAVACLATAMLMLDIAVVNTALPYLARDLHAGLARTRVPLWAAVAGGVALPVLGNGLGFSMSFRAKPGPRSTRVFLEVGALMGLAGVAISASKLSAWADGGSVITTIAVALVATLNLATPDRSRSVTISLWASHDEMLASEQAAKAAVTLPNPPAPAAAIDRYEVTLAEWRQMPEP